MPVSYTYSFSKSSLIGFDSLIMFSVRFACPFAKPLPTMRLISFPTPSAPNAALVKLVAIEINRLILYLW